MACTDWSFLCFIVLCSCSGHRKRPLHSGNHRSGEVLQLCFLHMFHRNSYTPDIAISGMKGKLKKKKKKKKKTEKKKKKKTKKKKKKKKKTIQSSYQRDLHSEYSKGLTYNIEQRS